jgi:GNAT superfamily N-acetyltransferase
MASTTSPVIRPAEPRDVADLHRLIHALAVYEREPDAVEATADDLRAALFPERGEPAAYAHVAEIASGDGAKAAADRGDGDGLTVVGMALWFTTFSTWTGRPGIWLEDLFVEPEHRGSGLGRGLLAALARACVDRGLTRLEWSVLDWNTPSIDFYRSLGAVPQDAWTTHRLDGDALVRLGSRGMAG